MPFPPHCQNMCPHCPLCSQTTMPLQATGPTAKPAPHLLQGPQCWQAVMRCTPGRKEGPCDCARELCWSQACQALYHDHDLACGIFTTEPGCRAAHRGPEGCGWLECECLAALRAGEDSRCCCCCWRECRTPLPCCWVEPAGPLAGSNCPPNLEAVDTHVTAWQLWQ